MTVKARRKLVALIIFVLAAMAPACTSSPVAPTLDQPIARTPLGYTINVPDAYRVQQLRAEFPHGVALSPIDAQARYDYTAAYHGSPNVYYGATAPAYQGQYQMTGIVSAPYAIASQASFYGRDWPGSGLEPNTLYTWVGDFQFTMAVAR